MSVHGCGHERVITIMASRKAVAGSLALHCYMFEDMSFACLGVDVGVKCNIASRPPRWVTLEKPFLQATRKEALDLLATTHDCSPRSVRYPALYAHARSRF